MSVTNGVSSTTSVQKKEIDMNEDIRRIMLRCAIKDQSVQVEYNGTIWTLLLRKKLVKPVGGKWNQLTYIDAYHMENDTHFGTWLSLLIPLCTNE